MNRRKVKKSGYRIRRTKPSDKFVYVSDSLTYERRKKGGKEMLYSVLQICVY